MKPRDFVQSCDFNTHFLKLNEYASRFSHLDELTIGKWA